MNTKSAGGTHLLLFYFFTTQLNQLNTSFLFAFYHTGVLYLLLTVSSEQEPSSAAGSLHSAQCQRRGTLP
jgi:hypothetical protein